MLEKEDTERDTRRLEPGTLWAKVKERTEYALECGALQSIQTGCEFVEQDGVHFLVRIMPNLARKEKAKKNQDEESASSGSDINPFLPYDKDLFVTDISDTHLCLLNKYNVIDHHLLMVTRSFEHQENWLTLRDFEAMWTCLAEIDGLVFYNGGKTAGASQRHKHLQLVPLPLAGKGPRVPIESVLSSAVFQGSVGTVPAFPFAHALARLEPEWATSPSQAASATLECYFHLLQAVGLITNPILNGVRQTGAYNLLATRKWMLIIPRSLEAFDSISVNSLGFAGALLVRSAEQMKVLKEFGPMRVLQSVALPNEPTV